MRTEISPLTPVENARLLYREFEDDRPRTILAALDVQDERILQAAIGLAQRFRAALILLHVVDALTIPAHCTLYTGWPLVTEQMREEGRRFLTKCIALVPIGIDCQRVYREGLPAGEIAAAAQEFHADLVLLGKHNHSLLHRLLVQSTCSATCHKVECPVAVLGDDGPPAVFHHSTAQTEEDRWTPQPQ